MKKRKNEDLRRIRDDIQNILKRIRDLDDEIGIVTEQWSTADQEKLRCVHSLLEEALRRFESLEFDEALKIIRRIAREKWLVARAKEVKIKR